MMNDLYKSLGGGMPGGNDFMRRFQQFRNAFSGDPRQAVQQLLNSGRVTQAQYDNAVRMANSLKGMMR